MVASRCATSRRVPVALLCSETSPPSARDLVEERRLVVTPVAVKQRPRLSPCARGSHHRQEWRDADAAGNKEISARIGQRKIVARQADRQQFSRPQLAVNELRRQSAADGADRDAIVRKIGRVAAQRVLPHRAAGEMQVDVTSRFELRQRAAIRCRQFKREHAGRFPTHRAQPHLQRGGSFRRARQRLRCGRRNFLECLCERHGACPAAPAGGPAKL